MHHRLASASQPAGGVATTLFIRLQPVARHHRPCFAAMQASPHVVCLQSMTWYVYGSVCVAQCRRGHWRGMGIVFVCVGACYAGPGKYPCGAPVGGGCPWGMGSCPQHHNGLVTSLAGTGGYQQLPAHSAVGCWARCPGQVWDVLLCKPPGGPPGHHPAHPGRDVGPHKHETALLRHAPGLNAGPAALH